MRSFFRWSTLALSLLAFVVTDLPVSYGQSPAASGNERAVKKQRKKSKEKPKQKPKADKKKATPPAGKAAKASAPAAAAADAGQPSVHRAPAAPDPAAPDALRAGKGVPSSPAPGPAGADEADDADLADIEEYVDPPDETEPPQAQQPAPVAPPVPAKARAAAPAAAPPAPAKPGAAAASDVSTRAPAAAPAAAPPSTPGPGAGPAAPRPAGVMITPTVAPLAASRAGGETASQGGKQAEGGVEEQGSEDAGEDAGEDEEPTPTRRVTDPQPLVFAPGPPPSETVYPPPRYRLRIDHVSHVKDLELPCLECHRSVLGSSRAADRNLPNHLPCQDCHSSSRPEEIDCQQCHIEKEAGSPAPELVPPPRLSFNHRRHLARSLGVNVRTLPRVRPMGPLAETVYGEKFASWKLPPEVKQFQVPNRLCLECHPNGEAAAVEERVQLPRMHDGCFRCHDGEQAPRSCSLCHPEAPESPLYEGGAAFRQLGLVPRSHDLGWLEGHRDEARLRTADCAACHHPADCVRCHEGRERPGFHRANWLLSHGLSSRTAAFECTVCHRREDCRECHRSRGVAQETFPGDYQAMFHPAGWMTDRNPRFHGVAGRRDLVSCISCHREPDCARGGCH